MAPSSDNRAAPSVDERVRVRYQRGAPRAAHMEARDGRGPHKLGTRQEIWLKEAEFTATEVECLVVGVQVCPPAADVVGRTGWEDVELDADPSGCFYLKASGACVRRAVFARLKGASIQVFGAQKRTPRDLRLPTYGPRRQAWRGDMGGVNFEPATLSATLEAVRYTLEQHTCAVIVDGTDDWNAPDYVRPEVLVDRYGIVPLAWWHTGLSGQTRSGVVLTREQYAVLRAEYAVDFGCDLEAIPGLAEPPLTRDRCGCWKGEGLRVFR